MAYLGIDLSSQSFSGLIIDEATGKVVAEHSVNFASDLPQYKTENGFVKAEGQQVFSYPTMFLDAAELFFEAIKEYLPKVKAISLSGQQHASVYLNASFESALAELDPQLTLKSQLESTLSRGITPIWMDHSTTLECEEMAKVVGDKVVAISGSPFCERFTAAQIRKFFKQEPEAYAQTDKIHLVSSFMTSVFIGAHAAIDTSDGAGMNLMNLATSQWDESLLACCADNLLGKLPTLESADARAGKISSFFVQKYGFSPDCEVVNASGDNPNSLIGCGAAQSGTAVISLGTSDTFFSASGEEPIDTQSIGHVFGNPAGGFMSLICFRNGSLSREKVLNHYGLDWGQAEDMMAKSVPSEDSAPLLPYLIEEMYPCVKQETPMVVFDALKPEVGMTSLVESQFMSMKLQAEKHLPKVELIRLTGGASRNKAIAQIISNIFGAKVECISVSNSAALGAAMRAAHCCGAAPWPQLISDFAQASTCYEPNAERTAIYDVKTRALEVEIQKVVS